jgi:hypothetical protein
VASLMVLTGLTVEARAECKPAAVPVGDPVLVRSVTERLTAVGITTAAIAGCPVVHVHLERRGEQLHLRVADGYQRRGEREVRDVATAAAVIESWTLQEIEDGTLPKSSAPVATIARVSPTTRNDRASVGLMANTSVANDTSAWVGGELGGCVRASWMCIGASAILIVDSTTTNDATRGAQRSKELHALATIEVPRSLGSFVVSPGLGVGYGWASFAEQHTDINAMPLSIEQAIHSLRGRAQVTVSRELGAGLSLAAMLFGDVTPVRTDIADAPRGRIGFSLGLRFGVR